MNISDAIKTLAKPDTEGLFSVVGTVLKVYKLARTCDVRPSNGDADLYDVRLQAVEKLEKGNVIFPKIDSEVVVTFLNPQTGFISQFTEVETMEFNVGKQLLTFDKNGLGLRTEGADLKEQIEEMLDLQKALLELLMTKYQLMTNVGPTVAVMPNTLGELMKLMFKNKKIKTTIDKILQ